jgi:hypothetical protein
VRTCSSKDTVPLGNRNVASPELFPTASVAVITILATLVVILGVSTIGLVVYVVRQYLKNRTVTTIGTRLNDEPLQLELHEERPQDMN